MNFYNQNYFTMKKSILKIFVLFLFFSSCKEQSKTDSESTHKDTYKEQTLGEDRTLYNEDFKWSIAIPENFNSVSPDEWEKLQNRGLEAIENTAGEEIINQVQTIFVFKNGDANYLESNHQPFDSSVDGDYLQSCKEVNDLLYQTFKSQLPNTTIERSTSVEKIDNLEFQTFKVKINLPNEKAMHSISYTRLFGKKEFSVNIIYLDNQQGEKMLKAWRNSKFNKN